MVKPQELRRFMVVSHGFSCLLPSGKRLHNYGKSPFLMGKLTISMVIFNSYVSHYQRVLISHGGFRSHGGTPGVPLVPSHGWLHPRFQAHGKHDHGPSRGTS